MTLVGDDEVEGLNRQLGIVLDGNRLSLETGHSERRFFFKRWIELLFALQHGIEPLDRGYADFADVVELVGLQVLHVVQLGEWPVLVGRDECLKLFECLAAEVAAIDEKQNPLSASVLNEPIRNVTGGVGLASAARHLDESTRTLIGERGFEVLDCVDLRRT